MNTTFDFNRFKMVMRWNFLSQWTKHVRIAAGLTFGLTLYSMIALYSLGERLEFGWNKYADAPTGADKELFFQSYVHQSMGVFLFALFCFCIFYAANLFANMKTKQRRVAFLMLPATRLEKYLVSLVSVTLASLGIWVVAFIATDVLQYLFSFYFTPGWHASILSELISQMKDISWVATSTNNGHVVESHSLMPLYTLHVASVICLHSFYVLGGAFFRRHPALLTLCVQFLLMLLFGYGVIRVAEKDININLNFGDDIIVWDSVTYAISVVVFLIAGCFHWLAFKLFSRMQVINNKWFNV